MIWDFKKTDWTAEIIRAKKGPFYANICFILMLSFILQQIRALARNWFTLLNILFKCMSLCEKCPYSEFFWSVFSRIRTEYGEIRSMDMDTFHVVWHIEKTKHIHQLCFVILVCLLPCNFIAFRLKKLYFR